jgi:orotidine-5'-phosphate decarboxylase
MANPVYLAVDTVDVAAASALVAACAPHIGGVKLGLEFFCANGAAGVAAVMASAKAGSMAGRDLPLFLDLKLHDIPNTVAGAVTALAPLAPRILTVHAAGGAAMARAARDAAPAATQIVAVTVLTSLDDGDLAAAGVGDGASGGVGAQVARLAAVARGGGLNGVVASAHEAAAVRADWAEALIVVPGVRPEGADAGDQKRVMTPRAAMAAGASVLVIGRPITAARDPARAAAAIAASL